MAQIQRPRVIGARPTFQRSGQNSVSTPFPVASFQSGQAEALTATAEAAFDISNRVQRYSDRLRQHIGATEGIRAGLQDGFVPTRDPSIYGQAFDAAAVRVHGIGQANNLRGRVDEAWEANRQDPAALEAALNEIGADISQLRGEFPELYVSLNDQLTRSSQTLLRQAGELQRETLRDQDAAGLTTFLAQEAPDMLRNIMAMDDPAERASYQTEVLAELEDRLLQYGPPTAFTFNGVEYEADATRSGAIGLEQAAEVLATFEQQLRSGEIRGVFARSGPEGQRAMLSSIDGHLYGLPAITSDDQTVLRTIAQSESGGDPNAVSAGNAIGRYQFLDSTLAPIAEEMGYSVAEVRANPALEDRAAAILLQRNQAALRAAGAPVNDVTQYMAWGIGAGPAAQVVQADPNASFETIARQYPGLSSEAAIEANPQWFTQGRWRTNGEMIELFEGAYRRGAASAGLSLPGGDDELGVALAGMAPSQVDALQGWMRSEVARNDAVRNAALDAAETQAREMIEILGSGGSVNVADLTQTGFSLMASGDRGAMTLARSLIGAQETADFAAGFRVLAPDSQQSILNSLYQQRNGIAAAGGTTPQTLLDQIETAESLVQSTRSAIADDPLTHANSVGVVAIRPIPWGQAATMDPTGNTTASSPELIGQALAYRQRQAARVSDHYGVDAPMLTADEATALGTTWAGLNDEGRLQLLSQLVSAGTPEMLEQIAGDQPQIAYLAGLMSQTGNSTGVQQALRGQQYINDEVGRAFIGGNETARSREFQTLVGHAFGQNTASYTAALETATAIYVARMYEQGRGVGLNTTDPSGESTTLDLGVWEESVRLATGAIRNQDGELVGGATPISAGESTTVILPSGVSAADFEAQLDQMTGGGYRLDAISANGALPMMQDPATGEWVEMPAEGLAEYTPVNTGAGRFRLVMDPTDPRGEYVIGDDGQPWEIMLDRMVPEARADRPAVTSETSIGLFGVNIPLSSTTQDTASLIEMPPNERPPMVLQDTGTGNVMTIRREVDGATVEQPLRYIERAVDGWEGPPLEPGIYYAGDMNDFYIARDDGTFSYATRFNMTVDGRRLAEQIAANPEQFLPIPQGERVAPIIGVPGVNSR